MKLPTFTTFHALLMLVALSVSTKLIYWNPGLQKQFQMEPTPLFCRMQMLLIHVLPTCDNGYRMMHRGAQILGAESPS